VNADDQRLIAESLRGRTEAFGELVLRYHDRLYNSVLRIAGTPDDACDVVQETFLNAYQSLKSFKGDAEFFTWLYRIAFNAAITQKRKKKPTASLDQSLAGESYLQPVDDSNGVRPGEVEEQRETDAILWAAIQRLSTEHRAVLVMKDIDDLKYEQIAEVLEVPIGTVRSRLHRARLELRQLLEPHAQQLGYDITQPMTHD
jgi:RNA polymerase sigma-70 factor, ECF subfamily